MPAYQDAIIKHIVEHSPQLDGYLIDTVYFGGGTPSYFGADRIACIFKALKKHCHIARNPEITIEINPGDAAIADFGKLRDVGFNRLSIGVQCADDTILKRIGRRHTFSDAVETVKIARQAGFENISVDLIYGLPAQGRESWAETLAGTIALEAEHISFYGLKVEKGTQLYEKRESESFPDDDTQADMYLYAVDALARQGYTQYEISNSARRGFESKHNLKYWLCNDYIGFGPGAHSYIGRRRYSVIQDVDKYIERVNTGRDVTENSEEISDQESAAEYLMLRLRTALGISEKEYFLKFGGKINLVLELLRKFESNGWSLFEGERWRLTPKGFILSNTLIGEILEAQEKQWRKDAH